MRASLLSLMILASLVMAQAPADDEKKFASLAGKVVDGTTGDPVRRANLTLFKMPGATGGVAMSGPPPGSTASTDAEGKFSFPRLEPGRYMLHAEKAGYIRQPYGARAGQPGPGTNLTLEAGQKMSTVDFKLMPQAVISGRVLDDEGEPIPHAMINVLRRSAAGLQPAGMMGGPGNDVGEYRIAHLPPGRYLIRAEQRPGMFGAPSPASAEAKAEGTLAYVTTWYPGVTDEASAGEVVVAAGQQLSGIDIQLRKGRVFQISGKIQGAPTGANRLHVTLQPRTSQRGGMMFGFGGGGNVKPDGSFTIPSVMPGSWDLVAMNAESGRPQILGRTPVTVTNANVENAVILAGTPVDIAGRVVQEGDKPAPVTGQVMLQPAQPGPMFSPPGRIQDDGTFKISGVSRDRYRLQVFGLAPEQYVKSVHAGNVDITASELDLTAADAAPTIEVRVSAKGASVTGVVLDGDKASSGAVVVAMRHPFEPEQFSMIQKSATTDQNGRFTLQGLAPGEYRIYAWDSYIPASELDAERLKPFEKLAVTVKLKEEAREQIELKLAAVTRE